MSDVNPYVAPTQTDTVVQQLPFANGEYGGLTRLPYFVLGILNAILVGVVTFVLLGGAGLEIPTAAAFTVPKAVSSVGQIVLAWFRLKNAAVTSWLSLVIAVPVLSDLFGIFLYAAPEGYGVHKRFDTIGMIVFALALMIVLVRFAAYVYVMSGFTDI